jgi:hypothetical protein
MDHANDAGSANAGLDGITAETTQFFRDELRGSRQVEKQFRMLMKIVSPQRDFFGEFGHPVDNRHEIPRLLAYSHPKYRPVAQQSRHFQVAVIVREPALHFSAATCTWGGRVSQA